MRIGTTLPCLAVLLAAGCSSPAVRFPARTAEELRNVQADGKVEFGLKDDGSLGQVEFHVPPSSLPAHVLEAMDRLVPGGEAIGAEIEYADGRRMYEVTKRVDGLEREALFDEGGNVVEWEVEVEASAVPQSIAAVADGAAPGRITAFEEIRSPDGTLRAWHVKKDDAGIRYKIAVDLDGSLIGVFRETPAEIEVPVGRQ